MVDAEAIVFLIKLPYYLFHSITFGKYKQKEKDKRTYKSSGIIILVFSILGVIIYLLYQLSLITT